MYVYIYRQLNIIYNYVLIDMMNDIFNDLNKDE